MHVNWTILNLRCYSVIVRATPNWCKIASNFWIYSNLYFSDHGMSMDFVTFQYSVQYTQPVQQHTSDSWDKTEVVDANGGLDTESRHW